MRGSFDGPTTGGRETSSISNLRRRPFQLVAAGFALAVGVGTLLLLSPAASSGPAASPLTALFTATSAVCVTGLVVVDTPTAWSPFGQVVILLLIQVGGFGIMTMASLLGLLLSRRLGLQTRLAAATSARTVGLGDVRGVLLGVARTTLVVEGLTALVLTARWALGYGEPIGRALWFGVFHAVSAFNNAGFALFSDSLIGFASDPWICVPLTAAVIVGGLGFPVILEIWRQHRRPSRWSLHSKITVLTTGALLLLGTLFFLVAEWSNTLAGLSPGGRLLAGWTQSVMPRTAGFNSIDTGQLHEGTLLGTDILMFIGGGSASTAGGIKLTTFAVLLVVIWSEVRGDPDVSMFDRRIAASAQRQAVSVALVGVAVVIVPTVAISLTSPFGISDVLFEVISASATVGLSTGITAELGPVHQLILVVLMFLGRLGPITFATALALRERQRFFRYPESAPIIG
ncbi:TrkH family potassium uptake protein [Actinotalea fermentans]|uniref:Potassium transporter Trk n=1 Tax=Actinotalea fermentans TaxID=43671 RepID=A0A511YUU9_9CELL|nr:potassium transporter TrkG [Actinotalea fermentans]GEN78969.1 potassium transporter Trk [Actinotalea fermentans]